LDRAGSGHLFWGRTTEADVSDRDITNPEERPGSPEILLAILLAASAGVHGTLVPEHARESAALGVGFAVAGGLQLVAALLVLTVPSRRLLVAIAAGSTLGIAVWALSRTAGLPLGEEAWQPEAVGLVDGLTIVLEAATVLTAVLRLARPRSLDRVSAPAAWLAGAGGIFALSMAAGHSDDASAPPGAGISGHAVHAGLVVLIVVVVAVLDRQRSRAADDRTRTR
jgi:hypothetical protein